MELERSPPGTPLLLPRLQIPKLQLRRGSTATSRKTKAGSRSQTVGAPFPLLIHFSLQMPSPRSLLQIHNFASAEELPEDWTGVSDMLQLRPLDRPFLFPGKLTHLPSRASAPCCLPVPVLVSGSLSYSGYQASRSAYWRVCRPRSKTRSSYLRSGSPP